MFTPELLHYLSIGLAISLGSIGAGIGQGIAAFGAIGSMTRQPQGNQQIFKTMVIGIAFLESGVILALVIALLTLMGKLPAITWAIAFAELGIALLIGTAATAVSIAGSFAVKSACESVARQPFFAQKILTIMLVALSIIEAPAVFAFIISLIIRAGFTQTLTIYEGLKLFAAAICMTIGCIGPSFGQAIFAQASCRSVGLNKDAYSKIFTFSIINQAVIETSLIFCLLVSILIIMMPLPAATPISSSIAFLMAGLTIGVGSSGTAIGEGFVAARSCHQIALKPQNYGVLFRSTILAQAFIESASIYALIIALSLLTKKF